MSASQGRLIHYQRNFKLETLEVAGFRTGVSEMEISWAELGENNLLYRHFFERAADGMLLATSEERILAVNAYACRIFKRSREEMARAGLDVLLDPKDPSLEPAREEWQQAGSFKGELSLMRGDKEAFPAEVSVAVCREGAIELMGIVFRDLTERKRTEEIRRHKHFYETLLKTQSDLGEGLFVVEDGHLVYCNKAFCEITGRSTTELAALPSILDLAVAEERWVLEEKIARRLRGEAVEEHYETAIQHASGRRVELEGAVRLHRRGDRPPQLVALVRDTTERKRAEEKARSSTNGLLALHEAGRVLNSTLDLAEIGERLLKIVRRVSGLDAAVLHLRTHDGRLRALRAFGPEDLRHAPSAQAARRAALQTKERQVFRTVRSEGKSCPLV